MVIHNKIKTVRGSNTNFILLLCLSAFLSSSILSINAQSDTKKDSSKLATDELKIQEAVFDKNLRDPKVLRHSAQSQNGWISLKDLNSSIRFGGFVQVNYIHDFQNTGYPYGDFIPSLIPVPTDQSSGTEFDPRTSRITFETQSPTEIGTVKTYFGIDFATSSGAPRLRQAYISWTSNKSGNHILLGQSWTTFIDLGVWPELFDLEGPNAMTGLRQALIRYTFILDNSKKLLGAVALEQPRTMVQNGIGMESLPDLSAKVNWTNDWGHLTVAGITRQLIAQSEDKIGKDGTLGWGLSLSGNLQIPGTKRNTPSSILGNLGVRQDNFKFQIAGGQGIGRYVFDLGSAPEPQDAYYNSANFKITALNEIGAFGAYQHWWSDRWRSTFVGGWVEKTGIKDLPPDQFKQSIYGVGNLVFRAFNKMDIGLEYYWGQRSNNDGESGHANRLLVGANYVF